MHPSVWTASLLLALAPLRQDAATPAPSPPASDADALLARMTLEEKVGQLFVVGANAKFRSEESEEHRRLVHLVSRRKVGGVIWYRSDVTETARLGAKLQALATTPLLYACDLEAGLGMRFDEVPWSPWAMGVAATGDPLLAEKLGRATALEARALGIAQIYAPVADVNVNADNPVINVRSFGEDPAAVARFVVAFCRGAEAGGALATVKHFPGHGDTNVDSHRSLPVLRVDRARLDAVELVPFRAAFAGGCRSVMVAHLAVPALDPTPAPLRKDTAAAGYRDDEFADDTTEAEARGTMPATISPAITTKLLRGELGFDGLVVTDAMDMGGLADHFDPGEGAVRAVLAGADQILKSDDPERALDAVIGAARSGRIPEATIDAAARRVLREKIRLGLFDPERAAPPIAEVPKRVGRPETARLFAEIAERSLTLVREAKGTLPLPRAARLLHVVVSDDGSAAPAAVLAAGLARRAGGGTSTRRVDPRTTDEEIGAIVAAAGECDGVVLSMIVRARSGSGKLAAPPATARAVEALLATEKPVVAVSLGSPYVLRDFAALPTFVAAYGSADCVQEAVAAALFGETAIGGTLPVTIPGAAKVGAGIRKPALR